MRLILPRIYSWFQQWENADATKTSSNFEKKMQNIISRYVLGKVATSMKCGWVIKKL